MIKCDVDEKIKEKIVDLKLPSQRTVGRKRYVAQVADTDFT